MLHGIAGTVKDFIPYDILGYTESGKFVSTDLIINHHEEHEEHKAFFLYLRVLCGKKYHSECSRYS
jgi:hypothetical protein